MIITAWRITKKRYQKEAFTGLGAKGSGGRWNPQGLAAIYTSDTLALAVLELLVHFTEVEMIHDYVAIPIKFDDVNVHVLPIAQMPPDWKDYPFPESTQEQGRRWLEAQAKAILKVPSVVVPQQHHNYILNPLHPDFHSFKIGAAVENPIDSRLI
jgi:RES domain-containing protein